MGVQRNLGLVFVKFVLSRLNFAIAMEEIMVNFITQLSGKTEKN